MTPRLALLPAAALAALLAVPLAAPLAAQDAEEPQGEPSGFDLIGQGAGQIVQGFAAEAAPALGGLAEGLPDWSAEVFPTVTAIVTEMGPGFFTVFREVDSLANYEAPAIQENGDILIRRSEDAPEWAPAP